MCRAGQEPDSPGALEPAGHREQEVTAPWREREGERGRPHFYCAVVHLTTKTISAQRWCSVCLWFHLPSPPLSRPNFSPAIKSHLSQASCFVSPVSALTVVPTVKEAVPCSRVRSQLKSHPWPVSCRAFEREWINTGPQNHQRQKRLD